jgi:hypothetical protein
MKRRQKKLMLSRETLRNLEDHSLHRAAGGRSENTLCPLLAKCTGPPHQSDDCTGDTIGTIETGVLFTDCPSDGC